MLERMRLFTGAMDDLVQSLHDTVEPQMYFGMNPDCYNKALHDEEYREILEQPNSVVYIDGNGIIIAQHILGGVPAQERVCTTDLFPALYEFEAHSASGAKSFFLFGGTPGTVERVRNNFIEQYGVDLFIGTNSGYDFDSNVLISKIANLQPDYLFVGLGCPKQEKWVAENFSTLNVPAVLTCGGLFDYYSGNVDRAPDWMQRTSLEWFYRLLQEPKRLARRYLLGIPQFLIHVMVNKFKGDPL